MISLAELEAALREHLPTSDRARSAALAHRIYDLLQRHRGGPPLASETLQLDAELLAALQHLAGTDRRAGGAVISFGAGAQTGDLTIGDIARSIVHIHINGAAPAHTAPSRPHAWQIPPPTGDFQGREEEIGRVVHAVQHARPAYGSASIIVIRGMGGVGKTELAHAIGYRLRDLCSNGQYARRMRGAAGAELPGVVALRSLISDLIGGGPLPAAPDELRALYLSALTGTSTLILADDVAEAAQVQPLIPPGGSVLLITTRNRFQLPGQLTIELDVLLPAESNLLLTTICPAIAPWASQIAEICAYTPLALRTLASLFATNPELLNPAFIQEELPRQGLRYMRDPDNPRDPVTSVEASIQASYDRLPSAAQDALCQLSELPSPCSPELAAAAVEVEGELAAALGQLVRRSLISWDDVGRFYQIHPLINAFAQPRLASEKRRAIQTRLAPSAKPEQGPARVWGEDLLSPDVDAYSIRSELERRGGFNHLISIDPYLMRADATLENLRFSLDYVVDHDDSEETELLAFFSGYGAQAQDNLSAADAEARAPAPERPGAAPAQRRRLPRAALSIGLLIVALIIIVGAIAQALP